MTRTIFVAALLCVACTPPTHSTGDAGAGGADAGEPDVGSTAQALIGPGGGTLELGAAMLEIPAGALESEQMIRVTVTDRAVQDPFVGYSPVYRFEPSGLRFEAPATVRVPFTGDADTATVFWTVDDTEAFAALDTTIEGGVAVARVEHFSSAFVGTACTGDCCGRGHGSLDVLLSVDNSNSMTEEQAALADQIPRMARVFATGDLDGDGVQDVPALHSVRIGTVSSDMGTGGFAVPTCVGSDFGDDGILSQAGRTDQPGCAASYPQYAELSSGAPASELDAFVEQVACTAQLGTGGCGFEQQLESVIKAVTPSTSPVTFHAGTSGHADGANAGFLRPDALLATIVVTDENDCSASDPNLFDPTAPADLNLRCFSNPEQLHPASRYVDALRASRSDPDDVVFALIAGVPVDLSGADPSTILADARMTEMVDPAVPTRLVPSCNTETGLAFPPTRLVEVAEQLPGSTVQSICQADFTPAVDAILRRVGRRASGACTP